MTDPSDEATPNRPLIPANENPWYILATLYDEQNEEEINSVLHKRNRAAWNAWSCQNLSDDERREAAKSSDVPLEELAGWRTMGIEVTRLHKAVWHERNGADAPWPGLPEAELEVNLERVEFSRPLSFGRCVFSKAARFPGAKFDSYARFEHATFDLSASFDGTTFSKYALFEESTFNGGARFNNATFERLAWFNSARFNKNAHFDGTMFSEDAHFEQATFSGEAWFDYATFTGDARFDETTFCEDIACEKALFIKDANFGAGITAYPARTGEPKM
jgi:hypothetical protein